MVARLHVGDRFPNLFNDAGSLVAKNGRRLMRIKPFNEMQIAVTDAGGDSPYEDFII
jgi:hypothetical protein